MLPRGIWQRCPDNCPSNSCRQLLSHLLVSSSPNLPCSVPSASLHRVCAVGTLPRCPFVGPFPLSLRPSRTEGLLGLPHHVLPLFCCHGPPHAAQCAISFVAAWGLVASQGCCLVRCFPACINAWGYSTPVAEFCIFSLLKVMTVLLVNPQIY